MDHLYKIYDLNFDVDLLKQEVLKLLKDNPWTDVNSQQLALQYGETPGYFNDLDRGYGTGQRLENEITNWNTELEDSYIKECVYKVHPNPSGARIMILGEGECYPTHVDGFKNRYQIPVFTIPPLDYWVFPKDEVVFSMEPGKAYWLNTHALHSYVSGTAAPRINIIFNDVDDVLDTSPQETEEFLKYREMITANKEAIDEVYNHR